MALTLVLIALMLKCLVDLAHKSTLPFSTLSQHRLVLNICYMPLSLSSTLNCQGQVILQCFALDQALLKLGVKCKMLKDVLVEYDWVSGTSG